MRCASRCKPEIIEQKDAPVQEHVIKKPKDVNKWVVPIRHTTYEPELTVGSGIRCISLANSSMAAPTSATTA